jgi:glucose-1-phosphate cytidylyltransferase
VKAVILAGGLGTRMREETEFRPKTMVEVGGKPVLWHIMKILSSQGVKDFVICVGYKAEIIRDYFLALRSKSLDFTIDYSKENEIVFHGEFQEANWKVTVADTGPLTETGGRVRAIEKYVSGERFITTYGDGIADVNLKALIASHDTSGGLVTLTTTSPVSRFGIVQTNETGMVQSFLEKPQTRDLINIGYFVMEPEVFSYLEPNSILEQEPLQTLAREGKLNSYHHSGFWHPMDTQREAGLLNELWAQSAPWKIW